MAKKTNYGFEKRKREADRKAKQEQKLLRKREAAAQKEPEAAAADPSAVPDETMPELPRS